MFELQIMRDGTGTGIGLYYGYGTQEIDKAAEIARNSDVTILVCGDDNQSSGECHDVSSLKLFGYQHELIKAVYKANKNTLLVLESGRPFALQFETEHLPAIVQGWFGGEFGAKAIVNTIFGENNPSGRTAITFPQTTGHIPAYYSRHTGGDEHYIDATCMSPFPFGHGLSYTKFEYSHLAINKGKDNAYQVVFKMKNIGDRAGAEVIQLYVKRSHASVVTSRKLLKEFCRVTLFSGEEKTVVLNIDKRAFLIYDEQERWALEKGEVLIEIAASSEDVRLSQKITIA